MHNGEVSTSEETNNYLLASNAMDLSTSKNLKFYGKETSNVQKDDKFEEAVKESEIINKEDAVQKLLFRPFMQQVNN